MNSVYLTELEELTQGLIFEYKDVLITGASGLIGSAIVDALLFYNKMHDKHIQVYAMARNAERLLQRFVMWNPNPDLHLIEGDITKNVPGDAHYDLILHLASNADPKAYALYPAETITSNVIGIYNVLEYAKKYGDTKVFFASTMEVYGEVVDVDNISEEDYGLVNFNQIRQGYAESKRTSELMCMSYYDEYNIPCWVGRFGYIYGANYKPDDSKVIFQFIKEAANGNDILMKSEGLQKRSYCYYSDAVAAIFCIIHKGEYGQKYNIADSGSVVSIKELANIISKKCGTSIVRGNASMQEMKGYSAPIDAVLCSEKLSELGWEPHVHLEEGIARVIDIIKEVKDA